MIARAERVVIDLGTGDGRAVLARGRQEPGALVVGIDASAAAMAESSLRAARPARKGGLLNALFVVAAAEHPPHELCALAAEVTILFPWGSLLRGALALDDGLESAAGIAGLVAPGGLVKILVSIDPRDRLAIPALTSADRAGLAARWARHGLTLTRFEPAEPDESAASGSSWARRLAAGRERRVWRLELGRIERPMGPMGTIGDDR
jgi:16S rRNA (adenine(1408)-N(1))-methyltransferase